MYTACRYNITIEEGVKFELSISYEDEDGDPVDLTGCTACMDIRETKDAGAVIKTIDSDSGITLGGAAGTIDLEISAADTRDMSFTKAYYDLELYPGGLLSETIRIMEGKVKLSREVTRSND
jgi:hypothetical protein